MKADIKIKNGVMTVKFLSRVKSHILPRLQEMDFIPVGAKTFVRTKKLSSNEYDYLIGLLGLNGLGMAYIPTAEKGFILDTVVPDSMGHEMHIAMRKIKKAVGGSFIEYLCDKLVYEQEELLKALSCEQMDAVSLAIYNIEKKKQGIIIGDQTGIGKGRTAAAMIRYGVKQGMQPIFISEKPNLFSDLYRDMVDIGSQDLKPFIVNSRATNTHVKDKDGKVVYRAPEKATQNAVLKSGKVPGEYDYICATYSQFSSSKDTVKRPFLYKNANNNVLVMDEAHNASGASQTGEYLKSVLRNCKGVCFLSATFAKRADNMPIYAMKTAMSEANLTEEGLVNAITNGGVALQEVLAAQLVQEGQMVRRERSFDGIEVNYIELKEKEAEHKKIADSITSIMRRIIGFQEDHVQNVVKDLDKVAAAEGKQVEERKGTSKAGCDNTPYFSKVFNVINQMLFSINADDVADHAIKLLGEGKKPVIAFASTMGSFLEEMGDIDDIINADFATVLLRGLEGTLRYTVKDYTGKSSGKTIAVHELSSDAQEAYAEIQKEINKATTGISISPIDVIKQKITEAGYSCGEVTGRKVAVAYGDWALTKKSKKREESPLTYADIPAVLKKVMPDFQQSAIVGTTELYSVLDDLEAQVRAIPRLGQGDGIIEYEKESTKKGGVTYADYVKPKMHYFNGSSDWWITEWDGKDLLYGYALLNGDTQNAEWGYISLSEIMSLSTLDFSRRVELDFYFNTDKPLKHHLRKHGIGKVTTKKKTRTTKITTAQIIRRKKENTVDAFRKFNNNELDCLLINQSGSTGASAHAIVTDKVPLEEVKPRVMVILQPELDISTEIQKRGRINRTGQVLLPSYDYIISSIPAQKRFLMMLKNKLKSLDANTTSNQKNSGKQLDSADFFNKYGDKVIFDYVFDRPELIDTLNDPLNMQSTKKETIREGAASKVTGRVAVLPVKLQEVFYKEVTELYEAYVDYLRQSGEYDLEVEALNLKAETLEKSTLIGGKGGKSAFGRDTLLEKCECDVLSKPFTERELKKELNDAGVSKSGTIKDKIIADFESHSKQVQDRTLKAIEEKHDNLLASITNEKAFKKAKDEGAYIRERKVEIEEGRETALRMAINKSKNAKDFLMKYFKFFEVGKSCYFPPVGSGLGENVPAVCLGIKINPKARNPFAPSAITIRFALGDSRKLMVLPCSGETAALLDRVIGLSYNLRYGQSFVDQWKERVSDFSVDRGIRYIITGNILQAADDYDGKLVSYTTKTGRTNKGILMPVSWSPMSDANKASSEVVTPIANAAKHILSMRPGSTVKTNNEISISRYSLDFFQLIMPKKKTHIPIYTDKDVVKCLENTRDGFEMVSGMMRSKVPLDKMEKLIKLLGDRHSVSLKISRAIYEEVFEKSNKGTSHSEDALTKEAMAMFEEDKKHFKAKLQKQKEKTHKKSSTPKTSKSKKLKLMRMRAKAILILQSQEAS